MQCQEIQDLISAYFDGALDPSVKDTVDVHLKGCATCRSELEDLSMVVGLVRSLPLVEPPVEFGPGLREKLYNLNRSGRKPGPLQRLLSGRWSAVAAVAASFLLVLGLASAWRDLAPRLGGTDQQVKSQTADRTPADVNSVIAEGGTAPAAGVDNNQKEKAVLANNISSEEKAKESFAANNMAAKIPAALTSKPGLSGNAEVAAAPPRNDSIGGDVTARGGVNGAPMLMAASSQAPPERAVLDIKAEDPGAAMRHISDITRLYGGTVSVAQEAGGREMTVTVPDSQFDRVVAEIRKAGTVLKDDRPLENKPAAAPVAQRMSTASAPPAAEVYGKVAANPGLTAQPAPGIYDQSSLRDESGTGQQPGAESGPDMSVIKIIIE